MHATFSFSFWIIHSGLDKLILDVNFQWHSESQWHVLYTSYRHWPFQDGRSSGCVSGGQGSQSPQTRSNTYCGEDKSVNTYALVYVALNLQEQYKLVYEAVLVFLA